MNLKIGFSTGCLHQHYNTVEALKFFKKLKYNAVELGLIKIDRIKAGWLDQIKKEHLEPFEYVSIHMPKFDYDDNDETKKLLEKIKNLNKLRKLDLVVIHPDNVIDFSIFKNASLPIAFENMDSRKEKFHYPDEFLTAPIDKIVLDVNHIYTVDKSMKLTNEFYQKLGEKISEIHLSGFSECHDPLFKTKQDFIINAIQNFSPPIIIESLLDPNEMQKEMDYILSQIINPNES